MVLFDYRSIDHCTTGRIPAFLLYKRELRTRFDYLRPNVNEMVDQKRKAKIVAKSGNRNIDFQSEDEVFIDDHGVRSEKRIKGTIIKKNSVNTHSKR